jgi:replication-associated recombination protein RarA
MIPRTINGLDSFEIVSALQKHIRRGEEREAMHCFCELAHTSKAFFTRACNRLEIISHEDIGLANLEGVLFTAVCVDQAKRFYDPEKHAKWRMPIGNAIRALCRGQKSREGDHFQAAIGGQAMFDGIAPEIPDYALDGHTRKGKMLGRGPDFFREVSCKLIPKPNNPDPYEDEAHAFFARRRASVDAESGFLF